MESILLVEKALEFKFPGIYHQLFHDNLLDSNKSNTNRFTVYDINFKNSFPDFLSAHDFTLLKPKLIMELTNDIYDQWFVRNQAAIVPNW